MVGVRAVVRGVLRPEFSAESFHLQSEGTVSKYRAKLTGSGGGTGSSSVIVTSTSVMLNIQY